MKAHRKSVMRLTIVTLLVVVMMLGLTASAHAFGVMREQTDAEFAFTGSWSTWSNPGLSGGSYAYANTAGSSVSITFEGTSCDVIARTGPDFGYAAVLLDGQPEPNVSMYSATPSYMQTVYSTGTLEAGRHTIEISYTGLPFFPPMGGTYINVDAISIAPAEAAVWTPYAETEESDGLISFRATWNTWSSPALSGGAYAYTDSPGAVARIDFTTYDGQPGQVDLFGRMGPEFGYAKVTLDDGPSHYVDFYSPTTQYQQRVYSTWQIASGEHTLLIEWTGRKNPLATGTYIDVDTVSTHYAEFRRAPLRIEQTDVRFATTGAWGTWANPGLSGGSYIYSDAPGASVSLTYEGWHTTLLARTGPEFGQADVFVDGVQVDTIDLYSPTTQYRQTVFDTHDLGALDLKVHTVTLQRSGTKNPLATGYYINVDAADCGASKANALPDWRAVYQEDSHHFASTGGWSTWASPNLSAGKYAYVNHPASKTIVMTGSHLQLFARKGPEFGYAKVTVDGVSRLIDLYSPTTMWQEQVCSTWDIPSADHVFTIEWTGLKNPAATGTSINVDRVEMMGNARTYLRYEQNDDRVAYTGSWASWSNAALSGSSYAFTNVTGATCTIPWYGYRLDLIGRTGPEFGKVYISLDGGPEQLVDLYSPTTQYQQMIWTSDYIATAQHTVRIRCAGQQDVASTGTWVGVDAFDVVVGTD